MGECDSEVTLISRGLRLVGKLSGAPDGAPALALHGWLDNANSFDPLLPHLAERRWLALDLPGHGASQHRSRDADYHFVDWVADVVGALDALGWSRCVVMGHSLGAGIALYLAAAFPERVERLVLLDGIGPPTALPEDMPARLAAHIGEMQRQVARQPPVYPSRAELARRLARIIPNLSPASAARLTERGTRPHGEGFTWRCDPRLRATAARLFSEAQVLATLAAVDCPTLLVRPDDGYPATDAILTPRLRALRRLEMFGLPGGHHAHMETPAPVAAAVRAFLSGGPGPGPTASAGRR